MNSRQYSILNDEDVSTLEKAIQLQGAKFSKVRHAYFYPEQRRGLVAISDIRVEEPLITLPKGLAICLSPRDSCPVPEYRAFWEANNAWYVRLGLKLLLERDKSARSPSAAYISFLPTDTSAFPVEWPPAAVDALADPALIRAVARQRARWAALAASFHAAAPSSPWTEADLRWAWHVCLSRAFAGRFGAGPAALVPIFGLLAELAAAAGAEPDYALVRRLEQREREREGEREGERARAPDGR